MAKPIKDTPTLKGKDAKRFLTKFQKSSSEKLASSQIAKMRENFSKMNSIAKF